MRPSTPHRERPPRPLPDDLDALGDDWRRLADRLGVYLLDRLAPEPQPADVEPPPPQVFVRAESLLLGEGSDALLVAAPRGEKRAATAEVLARHPDLARRVALSPPREIRRALIETHAAALAHRACRALAERTPELSALATPSLMQLALLTVGAAAWAIACFDLGSLLGVTWTLFFLGIGFFRAWIADDMLAPETHPPVPEAELPRFAVLVPLYHEAAVVPALVAALLRLDYPADRLDLRLVIEADDEATRRAAERATRGTAVDIVEVPPCRPRTKPKALNFALATVDADIVTIYDAEDRPDPSQLRRAAAAFHAGDESLAVVQAALEIDHAERDRPWLVRQFEIEYAMLFHGLLPWLSRKRLFLPLGGTSNHFRRSALERVGAWDPHNVTEDIDIAVRIARAGLTFEMIASATREEAPTHWHAWQAQRVRWLKGWLQTWFVHLRDPRRLHRELGLRNAVIFHLVLTGQLVSAFVFAPSLAVLALESTGVLPLFADRRLEEDIVFVAALTAFATGVLGALALAAKVMARQRRPRLFDILTMPFYWCAISLAAGQAFVELLVAPSHWNKTTHGRAARVSDPLTGVPGKAAAHAPKAADAVFTPNATEATPASAGE